MRLDFKVTVKLSGVIIFEHQYDFLGFIEFIHKFDTLKYSVAFKDFHCEYEGVIVKDE